MRWVIHERFEAEMVSFYHVCIWSPKWILVSGHGYLTGPSRITRSWISYKCQVCPSKQASKQASKPPRRLETGQASQEGSCISDQAPWCDEIKVRRRHEGIIHTIRDICCESIQMGLQKVDQCEASTGSRQKVVRKEDLTYFQILVTRTGPGDDTSLSTTSKKWINSTEDCVQQIDLNFYLDSFGNFSVLSPTTHFRPI
jgi:hypothetical protein